MGYKTLGKRIKKPMEMFVVISGEGKRLQRARQEASIVCMMLHFLNWGKDMLVGNILFLYFSVFDIFHFKKIINKRVILFTNPQIHEGL